MSTSPPEDRVQSLATLVNRNIALPAEILLVVAGAIGLAVSSPNATVWTLGFWVVLAIVYVAVASHRLIKAMRSAESNRELLPGDSPNKSPRARQFHLDFTIIGVASAMGLTSAITVSLGEVEGDYALAARVLAPLGIVFSWILMELGFARLYATNWFRDEDGGGITFWDTEDPGLIEFTHFAFNSGSAYVTTSRMRLLQTAHTVISLLYRTTLFAFAVSMIPMG